jgi:tetratricopeptide (TPR) repeat protein
MNELVRPSDSQAKDASSSFDADASPHQVAVMRVQETAVQIQKAALEAQKIALASSDQRIHETALALQLGAAELLKTATSLHFELLSRRMSDRPQDAASLCTNAYNLLSAGRIADAIECFRAAVELDAEHPAAHKGLGDCYLQGGAPKEAIDAYELARRYRPNYPELENNLALAYLACFDNERAQAIFYDILLRDHGMPAECRASFKAGVGLESPGEAYASPFKLIDRVDQLCYLIEKKLIDTSFQELVDAYRALLVQLRDDADRKPYTALTPDQLGPFRGYYDKLIYYRSSPRIGGYAVNPDIDWKVIEEEYLDTKCLAFDDLLTEKALKELRQFFIESTIFFRHSEAGFVGSYITDGFSCGLVFQILEELRLRLPRLLTDKPINNMWCYRYNDKGVGVRPHNGDGSVTINFYLTPDEANIGDPAGGGMVMYDKVHPDKWDWLTFNLHKDDPAIQRQISEYLQDAKSTVVPYKCNRAVLFHSTLFHKTDPFHFRDSYESRRMNITMLFGKRGQESAPLR